MLIPIVLIAAVSANGPKNPRNRRNADPGVELVYEGEFPTESGLSARRSIFADPRFQQGIAPNILRRYKHLEKLINFYDQSITNITKYWTYGCWCFQMGDYPLRIGNGSPVDNVDKICKQQKECYQCAKKDMAELDQSCLPEETSYKFSATFDQVTGAPNVVCRNPAGTCKRNMCECDRAFAAKLPAASEGVDGWNGAHHAHYGGFDSRQSCLSRIKTPGNGQGFTLECCGEFPERYPLRFANNGSGKQCCNNNAVFNSDTHCCDVDTVRTNGSC